MSQKKSEALQERAPREHRTVGRRAFMKVGALGTAASAAAVTGLASRGRADDEAPRPDVTTHDEFPHEIRDDYRPHNQWDTVHHHAFFGGPLQAAGVEVDPEIAFEQGPAFLQHNNYEYDNSKKGYDQLSKAVMAGGWALSNGTVGPSPGAIPDFGLFSWEQRTDKPQMALMNNDFVQKERYQFESKEQAADAIKRAARLYGADLVGIARRNPKWDYAQFFNPVPPMGRKLLPDPPTPEQVAEMQKPNMGHTPDKWFYGWDRFPFEPKSVIVMAFEMDYEGSSASPTEVAAASAAEGYSQMAKSAYQLSVFFKALGYHAVAAGNDLGLSVPYAIEAGLGEGSRMGLLVTYQFGPRVRLAKVYTDFDFVEYDKPTTFGVMDFCRNCMRCADACPSKALPKGQEPTFESEDDDDPWYAARGVKKYHGNAKKCFKQWVDNKTDCANCIASCPYNKPDFWHHRLVEKIGRLMPGAAHGFMREMDVAFGYGDTYDPKAVDRFFANRKDRKYKGGL